MSLLHVSHALKHNLGRTSQLSGIAADLRRIFLVAVTDFAVDFSPRGTEFVTDFVADLVA